MSAQRHAMAVAAMLMAACVPSGPAPAPALSPDTAVAGTYELVLCDGCDPDEAPAAQRIRVSLYEEPLFVSGPLTGADPPYEVRIFHRRLTLERENYCFVAPPDTGVDWSAATALTPLPYGRARAGIPSSSRCTSLLMPARRRACASRTGG